MSNRIQNPGGSGGPITPGGSGGPISTDSAIDVKYKALGGATSFLGAPVSPETRAEDGVGLIRHYEGGSIYWTPQTGAHEVHGAIRDKWESLNWQKGFLGYPLTDESTCPDGKGRFNQFQGGSIYWTPETGAHEVHGLIRAKWESFGRETSFLRYPLTDESTCPDGKGKFNHFQGGSIYWTPDTDAHEVHGDIRQKWADFGWETGFLGYPITDQTGFKDNPELYNNFQGGAIHWVPGKDIVTRKANAIVTHLPPGVPWPATAWTTTTTHVPAVTTLLAARPILETAFTNTPVDASYASVVCTNKKWMVDPDSPAWEWTPMLDSKNEFETYSHEEPGPPIIVQPAHPPEQPHPITKPGPPIHVPGTLLGVSGTAVNPDISGADVQFSHPFGTDFEFYIAPDPKYTSLLAPANMLHVDDSKKRPGYSDALSSAQRLNLGVPGTLGVEIDGGFVPAAQRTQHGDRVAVFGRFISDCGHDDFHTEIHPPLILATARPVSADQTHSTVVGRPFLVSQEFGDGALRQHITNQVTGIAEAADVGAGVGAAIGFLAGGPVGAVAGAIVGFFAGGEVGPDQVEAKPNVYTTPFSGIHTVEYVVRPPSRRHSPGDRLIASFQFTVRTGVSVRLFNHIDDEAVGVQVSLDSSVYPAATLPARYEPTITIAQIRASSEDAAKAVDTVLSNPIYEKGLPGILEKGVKTYTYDAPTPPNQPASGIKTVEVGALPVSGPGPSGGPSPFSVVDNVQAFPIYGWLDVRWERA